MPGVDENNNPATILTGTTYDWAGKVLTKTDANNHTITNTYDQRERFTPVVGISSTSTQSTTNDKGAEFGLDRCTHLLSVLLKRSLDALRLAAGKINTDT